MMVMSYYFGSIIVHTHPATICSQTFSSHRLKNWLWPRPCVTSVIVLPQSCRYTHTAPCRRSPHIAKWSLDSYSQLLDLSVNKNKFSQAILKQCKHFLLTHTLPLSIYAHDIQVNILCYCRCIHF